MSVDQLVNEFHEKGYCIIPKLLSDDEVDRVLADLSELLNRAVPEEVRELPLDAKYLWMKQHADVLRQKCYSVMGQLDSVRRAYSKPIVSEVVRRLLETPALLDMIQIRVDDPSNDRVLPMHQERGQMSKQEITGWLPMVEITENSGGVQIVEGSHRLGDLPVYVYDPDRGYTGVPLEYLGNEQKVMMNRGDLLLFHWNLIHGSYENRTEAIRWVGVGRFNSLNELPYIEEEDAPLRIPKALVN